MRSSSTLTKNQKDRIPGESRDPPIHLPCGLLVDPGFRRACGIIGWSHFFASRISASAARTVVNALIVDSGQEPNKSHSRRKPGPTSPRVRLPDGSRLSPGMLNDWAERMVSFLCLADFGERGAHRRECAHRRL